MRICYFSWNSCFHGKILRVFVRFQLKYPTRAETQQGRDSSNAIANSKQRSNSGCFYGTAEHPVLLPLWREKRTLLVNLSPIAIHSSNCPILCCTLYLAAPVAAHVFSHIIPYLIAMLSAPLALIKNVRRFVPATPFLEISGMCIAPLIAVFFKIIRVLFEPRLYLLAH